MSVVLSATGRITIPYTISGFLHKFRVFVRNPTVAGGTFNINSRATDANDTDWLDAAHDLAQTFSYLMPTTWVMGDAVLETRSGSLWSVVSTATLTITDHKNAVAIPGAQTTFVLRDLLFHKVKLVILESNVIALAHYPSLASLGVSTEASFAKEFTISNTLTHAPYNWMVSRGNQYLNTASFVGYTEASNRRVRRRRGLA